MSENKEDEGIHFDPTEQELIQTYLIPKLRGEPCEDDFIEMKDVYAKEPWLLDHTNGPFFKKNQWYYFVTREIIGVKQSLTFSKSDQKNKKKQKRGDGTCATVPGSKSSWIMKEFTLPPKEDEFQNIFLCRIKEKKNSKKKDDHHQEASTSDYNHHLNHEVVLPSYSEHQPINDHESVLASSSEQQPINDHEYALASYSEYQPINDHFLASYSEYQSINEHEFVLPSYLEHQTVNDHESVLASYSEYQPINDQMLASYSEYQPIIDHVLASYSEYQSINEHELVLPSYLEHQPINEHELVLNEIFHHYPECLIDNESAKLNERTREHNALERSETLGSEEQEAGETEDWVQEFVNSLLAPNGSDVPIVEEDQEWLLDVPQLHEETERIRF